MSGKRLERDAPASEDEPNSKKPTEDGATGNVRPTASKNCEHFVGLPKGYEYDQQKDEEQGKGVCVRKRSNVLC
jgi:hypothetical protein